MTTSEATTAGRAGAPGAARDEATSSLSGDGRPAPGALRTRAVHAGREDLVDLGVHAVPIDLSTTYPSRDSRAEADRLDVLGTGATVPGPPVYARIGNPTVARFEAALADLEGCAAGVAFASGMAALTACLLAAVAEGRPHVVAVRPLYGTSDHLLGSALLGTRVTWTTPDRAAGAIRPDTGLVVVETPANPTLAESGIAALAEACGDVPLSHHIVDPGDRAAGGISDALLRMSVGLEDVDDLWADLDRALRAAG